MTAPVLVLLNGLPASGKSTLARAWCDRHADRLPLALDVDVLRGMLGGWRGEPVAAGLAARAIAVATVTAHLGTGRDAVVPQHLRRAPFADALRAAAGSVGAGFLECVIAVPPDEAERRFLARGAAGGGSTEGVLGSAMAELAAEFDAFVADRPDAVVLTGDRESLVDALDAAVERVRRAA